MPNGNSGTGIRSRCRENKSVERGTSRFSSAEPFGNQNVADQVLGLRFSDNRLTAFAAPGEDTGEGTGEQRNASDAFGGMHKDLRESIIFHLLMLRSVYEDGVMPSLLDDGDAEERIGQLNDALAKLGYREEEEEGA